VKLSEEDLGWLYRDSEPIIVEKWLNSGVSLVIVTLGKEGLHAYTKEFSLEIPGSSIDLVDTVGAGDTVGAVLIEGILKHGLEGLLLKDVLSSVLRRAVLAAGINCSRAGANPPWASELG
jgi:fructokinase